MSDPKIDLDAIRARLNAATPGPWAQWPTEPFNVYPASDIGKPRGGAVDPVQDSTYAQRILEVWEGSAYIAKYPHRVSPARALGNAELTAHAPADLTALLGRVAELEDALLRLSWRHEDDHPGDGPCRCGPHRVARSLVAHESEAAK